jgi:hypothetical protein
VTFQRRFLDDIFGRLDFGLARRAAKPLSLGRRALALCLVAALGLGVGAMDAAAHSRLVKSDPAARAVLSAAPKEVRLWFNEAIEPAFAKIWIIPAEGPQIPLANHRDDADPRLLVATLPDNLPKGPVAIGYRVLSVDGHVVESTLTFTVQTATQNPT